MQLSQIIEPPAHKPLALTGSLELVDRIDGMSFRSALLTTEPQRPAGRSSGIARMAELARHLTARRADILSQLLRATSAPLEQAGSPLRPIWAFENFARAGLMIRLLSSLDRLRRDGSPHRLSLHLERDAADRLAAGLSLLRDLATAHPVPCSAVLRNVTRGLVELFGPTIGDVSVTTRIEPVAMPNLKRRALVLTTCNLVLAAMVNAPQNRRSFTLAVSLRRIGPAHLRLTVSDDGCVSARDRTDESWEAVEDLAAILEARLVQRYDEPAGAITELTFPAT